MPLSRKAIEQRQEAGKKGAQIKKTIMDYCLARQYNHDNNHNNESLDTQSNSEVDSDQ